MLKNIHVIFSEGNWSEEVCFTELLNTIIEFVKKIVSNEFAF